MTAGEALLDAFVNANILFCIAYILWFCLRRALARAGADGTHATQLRLLNAVFFAVVLAPLAAPLFTALQRSGLAPGVTFNLSDLVVAHYLDGGFEMKAADLEELILARDGFMFDVLRGAGWLAQAVIAVFLAGFAVGLLRLALSVACLRRTLAESFVWKRVGRVRVHLSDRTLVPFSTRGLRNYYVVIPSHMLERPRDLKVSLAHEFQHIRQGDLDWEVALEALRPVFYLNPAFHAWKRQVEALRELACDTAVLSRGQVDPRAYCDTLLAVCDKALSRERDLVIAVPKVALVTVERGRRRAPASFVEQRIAAVLARRRGGAEHRALRVLLGLPLVVAVALAALAIQRPGDWSQDRLTLSTVANLERLDEINRLASFGRLRN